MLGGWKRRALEAEQQLVTANTALEAAREYLEGIELRFKNAAILSSITRDGAAVRFLFIRNEELHTLETYGTYASDVNDWRRVLLEPLKDMTDGPA